MNADDERAQPFWSLRRRAQRVVDQVPAYANFELVEIPLAAFRDRWLPGLGRDGIRVGLNWVGQSATGYDVYASEVAARFATEPGV
jgi:hypothetical protein